MRKGMIVGRLIWDGLVERNPVSGQKELLLAASWKWVTETTLDLDLRKGIKFHNDAGFSADVDRILPHQRTRAIRLRASSVDSRSETSAILR